MCVLSLSHSVFLCVWSERLTLFVVVRDGRVYVSRKSECHQSEHKMYEKVRCFLLFLFSIMGSNFLSKNVDI